MTRLLNARILIAIAMIVFVGAIVASATGAFFSDTESSTGNTFAAGDIDLQIDNESYITSTSTGNLIASPANSWAMSNLTNQLFFSFVDLKPGDIGEDTISIHAGSNKAWACMAIKMTGTPENTLVDPETDAGDVGPALGNNGELQKYLNFTFWNDDGDNVLESGETTITPLSGLASTTFNGNWLPIADASTSIPLDPATTTYIGKAWCFGTLTATPVTQDNLGKTGNNGPLVRGTGFSCSGAGNQNDAQTDGIVADVSFQAVQSRNNGSFLCSSLPPLNGTTTPPVVDDGAINQADLATSTADIAARPTAWFFYNDTNDTVMTIDQFSGLTGQNHMESIAGEAGAKMVLDTGTNPRYNIATAQFGGTLLNTISSLKFRVYDATADSDTPFLHFNVDFATSTIAGGFQSRLVMLPGASTTPVLPAATWTTVDAIAPTSLWTWSGYANGPDKSAGGSDNNTWPDGNPNQYRTWSSIVAAFPNAKLLSPGSFLGVRTGQPGPAGATNFVSSIEFSGTTYNFEI